MSDIPIELQQLIDKCKEAAAASDYEAAHVYEDDSMSWVIDLIAADPKYEHIAKAVIALRDLDFARWCA